MHQINPNIDKIRPGESKKVLCEPTRKQCLQKKSPTILAEPRSVIVFFDDVRDIEVAIGVIEVSQ
jgi:hypothetical protein